MTKYATKIPNWPEDERPRERLVEHGPENLSDAELLAILLRTGNRAITALDLARHVLNQVKGFRGIDTMSVIELCEINGIGTAKAAQIKAALEIGKRMMEEKVEHKDKLTCSKDVFHYIGPKIRDLKNEVFYGIFLTGRNTILKSVKLYEGTLNESVVSPREIVRKALDLGAASLVLVHNHPSGDPTPSQQDKQSTERIQKACDLFHIGVLDHIIIGKINHFSFADEGLL